MEVHLLVLNYNGRALLAQCLGSIVAAANHYGRARVSVIDNASTDDSVAWLREQSPEVGIFEQPNRGLCSFNHVLPRLSEPVVVLLNNDVQLAEDFLVSIVAPFQIRNPTEPCFLTAARTIRPDDGRYDGQKTAVGWRCGLVQATSLFPGHEATSQRPGLTASAGAVVAVCRQTFMKLGGFDSLFLPGRLEDLDLAFRAWQAGYVCRYVPKAVAVHIGAASFEREFGPAGCQRLALRNTLLWQAKNLRNPRHVIRQVTGLATRLTVELVTASSRRSNRFPFASAMREAWTRWREPRAPGFETQRGWARESEFFRRFSAARIDDFDSGRAAEELQRARNYPLSRWWLRPLAARFAEVVTHSRVRPWHLSLCGAALALTTAVVLATRGASWWVALGVLLAWFFDRADGLLARRQKRSSPRGAWLDANLDELADVAWHVAAGAAVTHVSPWGWPLVVAFLAGKYLFMYGLQVEEAECGRNAVGSPATSSDSASLWKRLYHAPANADVRVHLLVVAVATQCLTVELALVAGYYHFRWLLRYALVMRRLSGATAGLLSSESGRNSLRGIPENRANAAGKLHGWTSQQWLPAPPSDIDVSESTDPLGSVSVALIVRDEARNLADLLPQLTWAREIVVVVDDRTTDDSTEVALNHGCRVVVHALRDFAAQRNLAQSLTSGDWILAIDADERPTAELASEIRRQLHETSAVGFRVPIRSRILGRPFRYSGTQDDRPVRLCRRAAGQWHGAVHERLSVDGPLDELHAHLEHDTLPNRTAVLAKIERYTDLAAREQTAAGVRPRWWDAPWGALREFARRWLYKQGWRDGRAGLEFCLLSGYSEWVLARKHARSWTERQESMAVVARCQA